MAAHLGTHLRTLKSGLIPMRPWPASEGTYCKGMFVVYMYVYKCTCICTCMCTLTVVHPIMMKTAVHVCIEHCNLKYFVFLLEYINVHVPVTGNCSHLLLHVCFYSALHGRSLHMVCIILPWNLLTIRIATLQLTLHTKNDYGELCFNRSTYMIIIVCLTNGLV